MNIYRTSRKSHCYFHRSQFPCSALTNSGLKKRATSCILGQRIEKEGIFPAKTYFQRQHTIQKSQPIVFHFVYWNKICSESHFLEPGQGLGIIQCNGAQKRFIHQLSQVFHFQMRKLKGTSTKISISLSYTLYQNIECR